MEGGAIVAACVAGYAASWYWMEHLWPVFRVWQESGVPLRKLDKDKARRLDNALLNWSAMIPVGDPESGLDQLVKEFPPEVLQAFDDHIHDQGVSLGGTWDDLFKRSCALRVRVAEFYQEPAVQAYLKKPTVRCTSAQSL